MDTLSPSILSKFQIHMLADDHVFELIKLILSKYFTLRIHHETSKKYNEQRLDMLRNKNNGNNFIYK